MTPGTKKPPAAPGPEGKETKDDPLWRFPWRLPKPGPGESVNLVELMMKQANEHPPSSSYYLEARRELLRVLTMHADLLDRSLELLETLLAEEDSSEHRCGAIMVVGGCAERAHRFDVAARLYRMAIDLSPGHKGWEYFSRNNLAYSLNQLGEFEEAAPFARQATEMEPEVFNAYKNLAVALEGQGQFEQAAVNYLRSTYLEPFDRRAYRHLVAMVDQHPELLDQLDYLAKEIEFCKNPVQVAMRPRN